MKKLKVKEPNHSNGLEWLRRKRRTSSLAEPARVALVPSASNLIMFFNYVMLIVSSFQVASSAQAAAGRAPSHLLNFLPSGGPEAASTAQLASQQATTTTTIHSNANKSIQNSYQNRNPLGGGNGISSGQHQQVGAAAIPHVLPAGLQVEPRAEGSERRRRLEWGNSAAPRRKRRLATHRELLPAGEEDQEEALPAAEARKLAGPPKATSSQPVPGSSRQQPAAGADSVEAGNASSRGSAYKNVIAQNGHSVMLHCNVPDPTPDLVVSWFRGTGELQLLTYDSNTIIPDDRFVVKAGIVRGDWPLQIKNLNKSQDAGLYQCQTNSEPPLSHFYQLNIVEPQVHILGAPDMAVKLNGPINLTCVISQSPDQLQFIFWYRNQRMINYDITEQRGKIVMSKGATSGGRSHHQDVITSNLQIYNAQPSDAGNYTCQPSGARPTSILVHVLDGSDKQLIMFQNDFDPAATSSQQTSSAISVHLIRLSRGRFYALFASLLIFASWFHLAAQIQTLISLLLLAIIGLFLGKLTDSSQSESESEARLAALCLKSKEASYVDLNRQQQPKFDRKGSSSPNLSTRSSERELSGSVDSPTSSLEAGADLMHPLIKNANSALNLLKTIHSRSDCVTPNNSSRQDRGPTADSNRATATPKLPQKVTQSPSASSSSSSGGSTGYNSDAAPSPIVLLRGPKDHMKLSDATNEDGRDNNEEDEPEMIELLQEPTALKLVMEELITGKQRRSPNIEPTGEPYYSAPLSTRTTGSANASDNRNRRSSVIARQV